MRQGACARLESRDDWKKKDGAWCAPHTSAMGGSGVRPSVNRHRDAVDILFEVLEMTRKVLWANAQIEHAELLLRTRARLVNEAVQVAGPLWTAEEEALVRRIAALDRELLERIRGRALATAGHR